MLLQHHGTLNKQSCFDYFLPLETSNPIILENQGWARRKIYSIPTASPPDPESESGHTRLNGPGKPFNEKQPIVIVTPQSGVIIDTKTTYTDEEFIERTLYQNDLTGLTSILEPERVCKEIDTVTLDHLKTTGNKKMVEKIIEDHLDDFKIIPLEKSEKSIINDLKSKHSKIKISNRKLKHLKNTDTQEMVEETIKNNLNDFQISPLEESEKSTINNVVPKHLKVSHKKFNRKIHTIKDLDNEISDSKESITQKSEIIMDVKSEQIKVRNEKNN